jgi:hypothetical protein
MSEREYEVVFKCGSVYMRSSYYTLFEATVAIADRTGDGWSIVSGPERITEKQEAAA